MAAATVSDEDFNVDAYPSPPTLLPDSTNKFEVTAKFDPMGDQPEAIAQLLQELQEGDRFFYSPRH